MSASKAIRAGREEYEHMMRRNQEAMAAIPENPDASEAPIESYWDQQEQAFWESSYLAVLPHAKTTQVASDIADLSVAAWRKRYRRAHGDSA
jgi:hypothetical protein